MICTHCKLKNDHADANQPDGTYVCFDCRKPVTASAAPKETGFITITLSPHVGDRRLLPDGRYSVYDGTRWVVETLPAAPSGIPRPLTTRFPLLDGQSWHAADDGRVFRVHVQQILSTGDKVDQCVHESVLQHFLNQIP